jgi:IclR family pca regulon transcriptional regulator
MAPRTRASYPDTWKIPDLDEAKFSLSLERGLAIFELFSPERPVLGIADIATALGMSRSTTHRYIITFVALGYMEQVEKRKYRLGLRVTELGMSALNATPLREHAHADLVELSNRAGYTLSLAVFDGPEIVGVDLVHGIRRGRSPASADLGDEAKLPVHCTALGKILLAYMPANERETLLAEIDLDRRTPNTIVSRTKLLDELAQIPDAGLAVEDEELMPGRIAIAVPIFDILGEITAALDMTARAPVMAVEDLADALGPHLISTADRISARLGYRRGGESTG